ncbi:hypothetical protein HS088_TW22G00649 [Tripterygium wilfordii]|uniref:Uncharacterized protein n=1 Tax=Tripterygium wilfordii TaxID=458696 RepID=A0A7J7BYL6_TRIWF|nr:hypothetical protein HS088_TW22G00649 [Tripterygium wilfordii]
MAAEQHNKVLHITIILVCLFFISQSDPVSARPLIANDPPQSPRSELPVLNENGTTASPEVPCDNNINNAEVEPTVSLRLHGRYGPLVLNMLPKGLPPPSGPSKGTNQVDN